MSTELVDEPSTNTAPRNSGANDHKSLLIIRVLFLLLLLYAAGSIFVAAPFMQNTGEVVPSPLDYRNTMYLHGLTVSMAGLIGMIAARAFGLSTKVRKVILCAVVVAVVVGIVCGSLNTVQGSIWTWIQLLSFFALDLVLIALVYGLITVKNDELRGTSTYWLSLIASSSMLIAALMGDVAGWLLDIGDFFGLFDWWATDVLGITFDDLMHHIIASHGHQMVVAILALIVGMTSWVMGRGLTGGAATVRRVSEFIVILGTIGMTVIYILEAFVQPLYRTPLIYRSAPPEQAGLTGVPLIDVVTGTTVMITGLILIAVSTFGRHREGHELTKRQKTTGTTLTLIWAGIVLIVCVGGFMLQFNMDIYGGPKIDFAKAFAVVHMDIAFFLFPAIVALAYMGMRWLSPENNRIVNALLRIGIVIAIIGSLVYFMINPEWRGPGFWITGVGFAFIVAAVVWFLARADSSTIGDEPVTQQEQVPQEAEEGC